MHLHEFLCKRLSSWFTFFATSSVFFMTLITVCSSASESISFKDQAEYACIDENADGEHEKTHEVTPHSAPISTHNMEGDIIDQYFIISAPVVPEPCKISPASTPIFSTISTLHKSKPLSPLDTISPLSPLSPLSALSTRQTKSSILSSASSLSFKLHTSSSKTVNRQKLVDELLYTETTYVEGLKLLKETYGGLEQVLGLQGVSGIPFVETIGNLIIHHRQFMYQLELLDPNCRSAAAHDTQEIKQIESNFSPKAIIYIAKMVGTSAIQEHAYEEYFTLADLVFRMMGKMNEHQTTLGKGFEKYFESVGVSSDLSFWSLLQKPADRLGKYILILKGLLHNLSGTHQEVTELKAQIEVVETKIDHINAFCRFGIQTSNNSISSRLCADFEFPIDCFGPSLLCGILGCVWKNNTNGLEHGFYGLVLYKAVIMVFIPHKSACKLQFVIPLCCAKVQDPDLTEGLYCSDKTSFKLVFEYEFAVYEILFVGFINNEAEIWKNQLLFLTEFVNGPYEFDFSASRDCASSQKLVRIPNMAPMEVSLDRFYELDYNFERCYFGELVPFNIEYLTVLETKKYKCSLENVTTLRFFEDDRLSDESRLVSVWSPELPLLKSQYFVPSSMRNSLKRALSRTRIAEHTVWEMFRSGSIWKGHGRNR